MQAIVDFILELDRLKGVLRKVRPTGLDRYENTAEHSWQIAMLGAALEAFATEAVDIDRVVMMLLVHDVGEIETGDTIFFAEEGLSDRKARELAAVTRIFGLLGQTGAADVSLRAEHALSEKLLALWKEFEEATTPEARLAHAADRAMPVLLNLANRGQSWRENGIRYEQVVSRVGPPIRRGCPALWEYLEPRLEDARERGYFGEDTAANSGG